VIFARPNKFLLVRACCEVSAQNQLYVFSTVIPRYVIILKTTSIFLELRFIPLKNNNIHTAKSNSSNVR
jgi:hypothetical protein